jgi:four helix bundle suffix protein
MTSYATAIELLDVARASLCELRDDYNKWLMMKGQAPWEMMSGESQSIFSLRLDKPEYGEDINRGFCLHVLAQYAKFDKALSSEDDSERANTLLILISRTVNMIEKYIKRVGDEFKEQGGFREKLSTVRSASRAQAGGTPEEGPVCPDCGAPTRMRKTRKDNMPFWGCSEYPACRGTVKYEKRIER